MMTNIRVSQSKIGEAEIAEVSRVMRNGYLGMGVEVKAFEHELRDFFGDERHVLCTNTGTAGLHLALQAIGLGSGDEVLVPSLTYIASFQAIAATGAKPIACDVNLHDGLLDLKDASERLTSATKAIMLVHYASYMGDLDAYYAFARDNCLRIVEDAAHAFGCMYRGQKIGALGDIVCFSFDGIKNITSGEGGAVVTSDNEVARQVSDARLLGVVNDAACRYQGKRSWEFDVDKQGWRYHMSDIMAAIGRVQLKRLPEFSVARITCADYYREQLRRIDGIELFDTDLDRVIPHIQPVRVVNGMRDIMRDALLNDGIGVGIHYKPNHLLSKFYESYSLPVSEQLYGEILTLPLYPELSLLDIDRIIVIIKQVVEVS